MSHLWTSEHHCSMQMFVFEQNSQATSPYSEGLLKTLS